MSCDYVMDGLFPPQRDAKAVAPSGLAGWSASYLTSLYVVLEQLPQRFLATCSRQSPDVRPTIARRSVVDQTRFWRFWKR